MKRGGIAAYLDCIGFEEKGADQRAAPYVKRKHGKGNITKIENAAKPPR